MDRQRSNDGGLRELARLAARQHGTVSDLQLRDLGLSQSSIGRLTARGVLHQIHRGAYAVGHRRLTRQGRYMAAVHACRPNAVISHSCAAWLWELIPSPPSAIHVTAPTRRHRRRDFRLHFAPLQEEDVAVQDDVPVTAVSRTLLDIAAEISRGRLERAVEQSDQLGLLDLEPIGSLMERVSGHRGVRPLRRVLSIYRPDGRFTRSKLERRFVDLLADAGLPLPMTNCFVAGYELDAFWPRERFAVELDTYQFHGSRAAFERDRVRQEDLKLAGIECVRITGHRIDTDPAGVARRVAELLSQRRRQLG